MENKYRKVSIILSHQEAIEIINNDNYKQIQLLFKTFSKNEYPRIERVKYIFSFFKKHFDVFIIFLDFKRYELTFTGKNLTTKLKQKDYVEGNKTWEYEFYFFKDLMRKEKLKNL